MASSSGISHTKYDVFISFRGEEVRSDFLSHLTEKLQHKKIEVYVDDRLQRGDEIWPSLVKAIEESSMSLIIFSKDYASSKWCLKELSKIMECKERHGHIVVPIFYHTDPTHVRHQTESYGEAFAEHDQNCKEEEVQSWRSALTKAANLSGFHASNYKNEAELVEQVAKFLSTKLNPMYPGDSRNNLVGMDQKVEELEKLMQQGSQDVRLIGIWGMGGIGKTTLATVVYHQFCYEYEGYYFQANVREESQKQGIVQLKKQIYERLLKEKDLDIDTLDGLPSHIKRKLGRTKILLVLDDINDSDQLKCLIGALNDFRVGSRIIVTTRDKKVLNGNVDNIYEVQPLKFAESLELFNLNASKENYLDFEWNELSKRVIEYAKELPLALQVLGSFLRGKSKEDWKSQMEKLERMPFRKIHDVLRLSYDSLDHQQKTIFLYIACWFKGYEKCEMIHLLNACGFSASVELTVLHDRALITWSSEGSNVSMHDLIEEMGREIVREESKGDLGKRSHLWDYEDVHTALQNNMGTALVESINLSTSGGRQLSLNSQVFAKMHNLKFLKFGKDGIWREESTFVRVHLHEGLEYLPSELRLLYWPHYPLKCLPTTFCAKNLVQLIMRGSKLEKLWDGIMPLGNLKIIDLSYSWYLAELSDFGMAKNLEEVNLDSCFNLCRVHPSILSLPKLEKLNLSNCGKLTSLGCNVHSKSLRQLTLEGCRGLKEFSVTSENMIELKLSYTSIKELPLSFASQTKLEYLHLYMCTSLMHLPSNFVDLQSLSQLKIMECNKLQHLPMLPQSIKRVYASDCRSLKTVQLEPLHRNMTYFTFENCMELDEDSRNASALTGCRSLKNFAFKSPEERESLIRDVGFKPSVIYPGSKVPKLFKYRTSKGSITMTIAPHSKLLGFIFCPILSKDRDEFSVDLLLENNDGEIIPLDNKNSCIIHGGRWPTQIYSDHVYIFYAECSGIINERVEESKGSDQNNLKLSFEFFCYEYDHERYTWNREIKKVIKKCGMYPVYAKQEEEDEDEEEEKEEDEDSEEEDEDENSKEEEKESNKKKGILRQFFRYLVQF